jgi:hypothetical protein
MNIQVSRNEIMSTSTSVQQATPESIVICKHQPGEVWDGAGCCTSRLRQSEAPSQEEAVNLETTSEEESEPEIEA